MLFLITPPAPWVQLRKMKSDDLFFELKSRVKIRVVCHAAAKIVLFKVLINLCFPVLSDSICYLKLF